MRFYIRVIAVHGTSSFFLCSDAQFWVLRGTKKLESMLIEISRAKWNPKHAISVSESVITVEGLRFAQFLFIVFRLILIPSFAGVCNAIKIQLMHDVSLQFHRNKNSVHVGFWKFPKGKNDGAPLF